MPEGRSFPWKYLPRRAIPLSVTFGEPLSCEEIRNALTLTTSNHTTDGELATTVSSQGWEMKTNLDHSELNRYNPKQEESSRKIAERGWLGDVFCMKAKHFTEESRGWQTARIRSEITAVIQKEVEKLGRRVLRHDV